jgi:hypothetical protein
MFFGEIPESLGVLGHEKRSIHMHASLVQY